MAYAPLGGSVANGPYVHDDMVSQLEEETKHSSEQQSLQARHQRQLAMGHTLRSGSSRGRQVQWNPYETPYSSYAQTSVNMAPYSPEHGGYYVPSSILNSDYNTDAQAMLHSALFSNSVFSNSAISTGSSMLQSNGYDNYDWQTVPASIGFEEVQLGLPTTTTAAFDNHHSGLPAATNAGFENNQLRMSSMDIITDDQLNNIIQTNHSFLAQGGMGMMQAYENGFTDNYIPPPEQAFDFYQAPRGFQLSDAPAPDFDELDNEPVDLYSPQQTFQFTPESIMEWFSTHYASKIPKNDLPEPGQDMAEENCEVICKMCKPYSYMDFISYRQHKEEIHGIDFKTGHYYWAPMGVKPIVGVVGIGFEGYCATCKLWIALDMSKPDFNWFLHASKCQDDTELPADPLQRYLSSGSEDEAASVESIKKEAQRRPRRTEQPFLRPNGPYSGNSVSNPSEEGSSEIWSSASSRSILTSNSGSGSSMSQHSLESRRKKVLRLRKRRGAPASKPGTRVYQCTFCMSDFANYGDWRRHEEVIHLVLDKWVCAPEGQYKNGTRECVYCDEVHEEQANIPNQCNTSYCHGKGPDERVFSRKDHLKQHLKRIHGITHWRPTFETWAKKAKGPRQSRCGFCDAKFDDWHLRMQHIAWEFKHGQKMEIWQGDWGLDSSWMSGNKLSQAILPKNRRDHISQLQKRGIDEKPLMPKLHTATNANNSAQQESSTRGLHRKPRLTSLRDGFSHAQPQVPPPIEAQTYATTTPVTNYNPSSDFASASSGLLTTPPSCQSPLAPYSLGLSGISNQNQSPESLCVPLPLRNQLYSHKNHVSGNENTQSSRGNILIAPAISDSTDRTGTTASSSTAPASKQKSGPSFQCPLCSKRCTRQDNLRRHMKLHLVKDGGG